MSKNDGPATTLRRRLLKIIAPITLTVVVLTAIVVIAAARLLIFPVYAETVSLLIENLALNLESAGGSQLALEKVLSDASRDGKFSYLVGSAEGLSFQDESVEAPELVMSEALSGLSREEKSRVRISGFGPNLRLLGITRLGSGQFLVVVELGRSFARS